MRQTLRSRLVQQLRQAPPEKLPAIAGFFIQELPPPRSRAPPPEPEPASPQPPRLALPLAATVEGDPATGHFCIRVAPANAATQAPTPSPPESDPESLSLAAKLFQLLTALDPDKRLRKAPPIKVFLLRFRQNLSLSQIALACGCTKSLAELRLQAIQKKLPWQPHQLRELSAQVEAMEDALTDSRAKSIYRKGALYGDEEEPE